MLKHSCNYSTQEAEAEDGCKFKASLGSKPPKGYIVKNDFNNRREENRKNGLERYPSS